MRRLSAIVAMLLFSGNALAGGPAFVAGSSYFDPTVKGTPSVWPQGAVNYYTDQGNLSPILSGTAADTFVANAFALWTSIPTAAVSATRAGQLAEDVSGANVSSSGGQINLPPDIQPGAVGTPVGIVYDHDGSVTDALLGAGASAALYCAGDSVFGGVDSIATSAEFLHALIVINGNCASTSSQLPDLQYHLARMIGRVLGLDWSQANANVITRKPLPTASDYAGFPVMHEFDPQGCRPVTICYSNNGSVNPAQPKADDQAALSRLYPVTAQNLVSFPGKQILAQRTARIRGTVYFDDGTGQPTQPMQGVNVVARWIDPATGLASRSYVVSSISGFLYHGNAGNIVSGYTDSSGSQFDRYGSDDPALQGYFDLAGLPMPGGVPANYQLTVEAVDPLWSDAGPYGSPFQVTPSGAAMPILGSVSPGSDVLQDVVMLGSAIQKQQWYAPTSYALPAQVPANGSWSGVLGGTDFFQFRAQANRSLSVIVDALDEAGNLSENKALPVVGVWAWRIRASLRLRHLRPRHLIRPTSRKPASTHRSCRRRLCAWELPTIAETHAPTIDTPPAFSMAIRSLPPAPAWRATPR